MGAMPTGKRIQRHPIKTIMDQGRTKRRRWNVPKKCWHSAADATMMREKPPRSSGAGCWRKAEREEEEERVAERSREVTVDMVLRTRRTERQMKRAGRLCGAEDVDDVANGNDPRNDTPFLKKKKIRLRSA